jgi:hypothetical protein
MNNQHQQQFNGSWTKLSLIEQLANVGSEVIRAINWRKKDNKEYSQLAFDRALELFDLTMDDSKNSERLKEVARARELFVDSFNDNIYQSNDRQWQEYFLAFNYSAQKARGL